MLVEMPPFDRAAFEALVRESRETLANARARLAVAYDVIQRGRAVADENRAVLSECRHGSEGEPPRGVRFSDRPLDS
jgi:hypothetical protein